MKKKLREKKKKANAEAPLKIYLFLIRERVNEGFSRLLKKEEKKFLIRNSSL